MNVNSDQFFHLTPTTTFETRLPWGPPIDRATGEATGLSDSESTKGILRTRHPDLPEHSALVNVHRRRSSVGRETSEMFSFDAMTEVPESRLGVPEGFHVPYWNLKFDRNADPRDWGDPTKSDFHLTHQPLVRNLQHGTIYRDIGSTAEFLNQRVEETDHPRYRAPDAPWARRVGTRSVPGPEPGTRVPQFEDTFRRVHHVNPQQYAPPGTPDPDAFMDMIFPFLLPEQHDIDATLVNTHKDFLEDIQAVGEYAPRRGVDE